ncbi:nonsense-mediated mRNA decay factor SMG9-like isoform X1 [Macrobrachium rosenbergii]|uniref:nonsense-mediated mRNA decay factor SMG9-like isoform X1 n=2 Tax=Macrobrachium rosenbergii TaxID=79674 RepID=UPI0034D4E774
MADVGDKTKIKKKIRKVFQKPDREFETFLPESMRAPVIHVLGKPPHEYKGGSSGYSNHYDHPHPTNWEKRGSRYHEDWEKRGSLGSGGVLRINENARSAIFSRDSGRPPGRLVDAEGGENDSSQSPGGVLAPTPVILSRTRSTSEQRSTSPNPSVTTARKDSVPNVSGSSSTTQHFQIASKPLMMEASLMPERIMKGPTRLLDESLTLCDDLSPYLLDQSNFLVVAMMGTQGVGKSSLASLFVNPDVDINKTRSCVFRPESLEQIMSGCHGTNGVDIYITTQRLFVLDCQPLLSPSIMDRLISQDKKCTSEYNSTENLMEIESLQLLTLVMSIAHVVVLMQDSGIDPNLIRLLQTCEMMKPSSSSTPSSSSSTQSTPTGSEDTQQYFPHVVFVHNHSPAHHFTPSMLKQMQGIYQETFLGSCLESESHVGSCNSLTYAPLSETSCGNLVNLFLLPEFHSQQNSVPFAEAIREMRRQVLSMRRLPLTHLTLTEKSWYQYVCRTWENVRKWSLFVEYSRLLP